jgi:ATP-dependent RNA helicase HelY
VLGRIELPVPYAPNNTTFQRAVATALGRARLGDGDGASRRRPGPEGPGAADLHPVASCPDARPHVRAAERADRLRRDLERLERRIRGRTESLARQFDRVLRVLQAWGYVDGWALTEAGSRLSRLYHESDLLVAESLGAGLLDGLDPASVAGLASVFTFEHRGPSPAPTPAFPSAKVRQRWLAVEQLAKELNDAEKDAGLPVTRSPDPGFVALAHGWAAGEDLDELLDGEEMSGGDFVRNMKQLIDLLRQLGDVAPQPRTAEAAHKAADALFRGVVAASSVVAVPSPGPLVPDATGAGSGP